jgi:hypothetical protein
MESIETGEYEVTSLRLGDQPLFNEKLFYLL